MEYLDQLLSLEIVDGTNVGDILSVEFLVGILGDIVVAALILIVGFFIAGWIKRRITNMADRSRHFDRTTGSFLGNAARYAILGQTVADHPQPLPAFSGRTGYGCRTRLAERAGRAVE